MYKKLLVATDLTDASRAALRTAVNMARELDATLTVVHVFAAPAESPAWFLPDTATMQAFRSALANETVVLQSRLRAALATFGVGDTVLEGTKPLAVESVIRHGVPADEIITAATEVNAELIVLGTHGRRGFQHAFMGSVAERVVRNAPQAVLVVKPERGHHE